MLENEMFQKFMGHILQSEGGYSNNPRDPGGETNFGITKRFFPDVNIKELTMESALEIYRKEYWIKIMGGRLHPFVSFTILDAAINCGIGRAVTMAQSLAKVPQDGVMGTETVSALNLLSPEDFCLDFSMKRLLFHTKLSTWSAFGGGWALRILGNIKFCKELT